MLAGLFGLFGQAPKPFDPAKERVIAITTPTAIYIFAGTGDVLEWRATFTTDGKPTPIPPGPQPVPPTPTKPLAKLAFEEAGKIALPARGKAAAMAKSFRSIASAVAAGGIVGIENILKKLKESNGLAVGESAAEWTAWGVAIKTELTKRQPDKDGVVAAFNDIAEGLEAVR